MPPGPEDLPRDERRTGASTRAARSFAPVSDTIITRAPTRIDFGGGWTDVPPYSDEMGGFVCNVAINRYATATLTRSSDDRSPSAAVTASSSAGDHAIALAAARRFRLAGAH